MTYKCLPYPNDPKPNKPKKAPVTKALSQTYLMERSTRSLSLSCDP